MKKIIILLSMIFSIGVSLPTMADATTAHPTHVAHRPVVHPHVYNHNDNEEDEEETEDTTEKKEAKEEKKASAINGVFALIGFIALIVFIIFLNIFD